MGHSKCFVLVHLGAGYHSPQKEKLYQNLINKCCQKVMLVLENSNNLIEALVLGIRILEDSGLTNAGIGSNKTRECKIECDASIMQLDPPCLGAVSSVEHKNPIELALDAFDQAIKTGKWSYVSNGMKPHKSDTLLQSNTPDIGVSSMETLTGCSDTVGIICMNSCGQIAMACSSGGPEGKDSGRIGPCALPGCGFWGIKTAEISSAALCTGVGEHIIIAGGARNVVDYMIQSVDCDNQKEFIEKLYRSHTEISFLEFGFVNVTLFEDKLEIFTSHSTPSFIYGWKFGKERSNIEISRLMDGTFKSFSTCLRIKG